MKKLLITILLFSAFNVYSQIELTAEKCREMALENSYDMQIASLQYDKMRADQKAVFSNFLPKISGSASFVSVFQDIDIMEMNFTGDGFFTIDMPFEMFISMKAAYMAGINLQQPIFAGGKIYTGNQMAKKGIEMTEENIRLTRMSTIVEAEKAYWIYVSVREKVKLLESYETLLDSLYLQVSDFSRLEMAVPADVQKVKSKRSNIKYELQRAKSGLELSRMSLCHLIGVNIDTTIIVLDSTIVLPENKVITSRDISLRPEYILLQKQVKLSELTIKNTRADFLPKIGINVGYTYVGGIKMGATLSGYTLMEDNLNMSLPMVMASVSIPIFHFGEGAKKIKSAKISHSISELELKKNSELMNIEVEKTLTDFRNSFLQIEAAEEAMAEAEADLKIAKDNYELKMGTLFDVLETQTQYQEAYSNLIEARTNCKIKEIEYLKSVGRVEN
ncbi:TolC family protein [Bacteroidales bacterium OttesenSCG-928-L14]|nr:TolC family protein [Bacteroidales bacterium OttesenSCG-928-L14]